VAILKFTEFLFSSMLIRVVRDRNRQVPSHNVRRILPVLLRFYLQDSVTMHVEHLARLKTFWISEYIQHPPHSRLLDIC